ncbi:MAG: hypothetical protein JWM37_34 [Candidatus Saccharibacteria bacterium]|nr:hypothetical protein [Candidatus Saccharibacteria bacterium]
MKETEPTLPAEQAYDAYAPFDREAIEFEAMALIENRQHAPEVPLAPQERFDNARTALWEALTTSGHLSRVEIDGDSIEDINRQVLARLVNGFHAELPSHEYNRRYAELCNELVIQKTHLAIAAGTMDPEVAVLELSDFPTVLPDSVASRLGYRAKNLKGMVRSTHFERTSDGRYHRVIEQISRSNADGHSSRAFLAASGQHMPPPESDDLRVLSTPLHYSKRDYRDAVVDIQRRLDAYSGPGVRFGEPTYNPLHVEYEALREESEARETQVAYFAEKLAAYEKKLDDKLATGDISEDTRLYLYGQEVKKILAAICTLAPEYSSDCLGTEATYYIEQAALYAAAGDMERAAELADAAADAADTILFCGMEISKEEADRLGLNPDNTGNLIGEGKEKMSWKDGVCRVKSCSSPRPTKVGPCSVCRNCQHMFDKGIDPTKLSLAAALAATSENEKKSRQKQKDFELAA